MERKLIYLVKGDEQMRKTLITMIIILTTLILTMIAFLIGYTLTVGNEKEDDSQKNNAQAVESTENNKKSEELTEEGTENNDNPPAMPIYPNEEQTPEQKTEETQKEEQEKIPEQKQEEETEKVPEQNPEEKPEESPQTAYPDYPQNNNEWYRVRTSAGSEGKQDGAFKSFANAKSHADTLKEQGYKVYDNNMNCIYTP